MRLVITDRFGVMLDLDFDLPHGRGATGQIEDARLCDIVRGLAITQGIVESELVSLGRMADRTLKREGAKS